MKPEWTDTCTQSGRHHRGEAGVWERGQWARLLSLSQRETQLSLEVAHYKHISEKWPRKITQGFAFLAYSLRQAGMQELNGRVSLIILYKKLTGFLIL